MNVVTDSLPLMDGVNVYRWAEIMNLQAIRVMQPVQAWNLTQPIHAGRFLEIEEYPVRVNPDDINAFPQNLGLYRNQ